MSKTINASKDFQSQFAASAAHPLFTSRQTVSHTQSGNLAIPPDYQYYHCNLLNALFCPLDNPNACN